MLYCFCALIMSQNLIYIFEVQTVDSNHFTWSTLTVPGSHIKPRQQHISCHQVKCAIWRMAKPFQVHINMVQVNMNSIQVSNGPTSLDHFLDSLTCFGILTITSLYKIRLRWFRVLWNHDKNLYNFYGKRLFRFRT